MPTTDDGTERPGGTIDDEELVELIARQDRELDELRAELADLQDLVDRRSVRIDATRGRLDRSEQPAARSRRDLLRAAGSAGLVGAVGATMLGSGRVAAADGDPIRAGNTTTSASTTMLHMTGGTADARDVLAVADFATSGLTEYPAAVSATASGTRVSNGLTAVSNSVGPNFDGATGYGVVASGKRANLLLLPSRSSSPVGDTMDHSTNEILTDSQGNLYHCVEGDVSPSAFRRLSGPDTAGALVAIDPTRVYDSRKENLPHSPSGPLPSGQSRVVVVRDGRNEQTNVVDKPDLVPAGATAIVYNLTIVNMALGGFLSVEPFDSTAIGASTINWGPTTDGALANSSMVKLAATGDRSVKVFAGGGGTTDFIIDVLGYYL